MSETHKAKLSKFRASQAVLLPDGSQFDGDEVYVIRDEKRAMFCFQAVRVTVQPLSGRDFRM